MRLSDQLLAVARKRLHDRQSLTEADLRRATSDTYYALFHGISECLVEPIGSNPESAAFKKLYLTMYRLLDHAYAEKRCKEIIGRLFSEPVQSYSRQFVALKNKRIKADYDPLALLSRSGVSNDIALAQSALRGLQECDSAERAEYAFFLTIRGSRAD